MHRSRLVFGALLMCAALVVTAVPVTSEPNSNNNNSAKLRRAVTVEGILEHERALQTISDASGGANRLAGAPGYASSADYVAARAAAAGFNVSENEFEYDLTFIADFEAPVLEIVDGTSFVGGIAGASLGGDFGSMFKSTPYELDITTAVWAIDLVLPPAATEHQHERLRSCGLCRGPGRSDHHRPAGNVQLRSEVHTRRRLPRRGDGLHQ